jgi:cob(I)alamin adenosyltransferase
MEHGLVHIYSGNGKGKTTAAIGLTVRACGYGLKILFVQFMKSGESGELEIFEKFRENINVIRCHSVGKFTWQMSENEKCKSADDADALFCKAVNDAEHYNIVVLDEILNAISTGLLDVKKVAEFLKNRPSGIEIVMTGQVANSELIELADYVSEIKAVKHPYEKGITARKGIEY